MKLYKVPLYRIINIKDVSDLFGEQMIAFVEHVDDIFVVKKRNSCEELYTKFKLCVNDGYVSNAMKSHPYIPLSSHFAFDDERSYYVVLESDMNSNHLVDSSDILSYDIADSKWYKVYLDTLKKYTSDEKKKVKKAIKSNFGILK